MRTPTTLLAASTLALALAGCTAAPGNDGTTEPAAREATVAPEDVDEGTPTDDGDAVEVPTESGDGDTAAEAEQTDTVAIDDFRFAPASIEVSSGTTVTFTNEDATAHTVTAGSKDDPQPEQFDERVDEKGQTIEWTFDEPGTYAYYCELHPFMEGTVTVTG